MLPGAIPAAATLRNRGRGGEANIHSDAGARKMGFARGFVSTGQTLAWISRLLVRFFGPAYFETGRFDCTFVAPVFDDEDIFVRGIVRDRIEEDDGVRLVCDVWLEKEDGAKSIVGTASAIVR